MDVSLSNSRVAVMRSLLLILLITFSSTAFSKNLKLMVERQEYKKVVSYYNLNKKKDFTKHEYALISYSMRKLKMLRQDISLNVRQINRYFKAEHQKLLKETKASNTIDPDEYPKNLKITYWIILTDLGEILQKYKTRSKNFNKDYLYFQTFSKMLVDLEFRESKVDKINNKVNTHLEYIVNKIYKFSSSVSLQYVSWQRNATLNGPDGSTNLNVTNRGYCLGGDAGIENHLFHFYVDGCFLAGSGGVKNIDNPDVSYQQSNVKAMGLKFGPGASMIVSSSKSRIGVRLPIIYTIQRFTNPGDGFYAVEETSPLSFMGTLYSRFQFEKWYLQTEFGKYMQKEEIFWGLGIGKQF